MEYNPHLGQYGAPAYLSLYTVASPGDAEYLLGLKKQWALEREHLMQAQQTAAKAKDYEAAKVLKPAIAELLQLYRAACLFAGHLLAEPPGDCPHKPLKNWGVELAPACRVVDNMFLYGERGTPAGVDINV